MKISFDPELLLSCLASSESYHASNWTSLWFELVKAMPEDERVFDLAHLWLYNCFLGGIAEAKGFSILSAVVERIHSRSKFDQSFSEFLADLVADGMLFSNAHKLADRTIKKSFEILGAKIEKSQYIGILAETITSRYFNEKILEFLISELVHNAKREDFSLETLREIREALDGRAAIHVYNVRLETLRKTLLRNLFSED